MTHVVESFRKEIEAFLQTLPSHPDVDDMRKFFTHLLEEVAQAFAFQEEQFQLLMATQASTTDQLSADLSQSNSQLLITQTGLDELKAALAALSQKTDREGAYFRAVLEQQKADASSNLEKVQDEAARQEKALRDEMQERDAAASLRLQRLENQMAEQQLLDREIRFIRDLVAIFKASKVVDGLGPLVTEARECAGTNASSLSQDLPVGCPSWLTKEILLEIFSFELTAHARAHSDLPVSRRHTTKELLKELKTYERSSVCTSPYLVNERPWVLELLDLLKGADSLVKPYP